MSSHHTSSPLLARVVVAVAAAAFMAADAHAAEDPAFAQAVRQFQNGRYADSYGRMTALANQGDPDAARIALFMYRYGPVLFGTHWDASTEEVEDWTYLAASARARKPPVFRPLPMPARPAGKPLRVATTRTGSR